MLSALDLALVRAELAATYDAVAEVLAFAAADDGWAVVKTESGHVDLACRTAEASQELAPAGVRIDKERHLLLFAAYNAGLQEGARIRIHGRTWAVIHVKVQSGDALEMRALIAEVREGA